ncbi:MAG: hypothetical protein MI924_01770, partial [Chloroflexales bacterium]|nr:hypothetical protein [Chloroflexales bacterium]
MTDTPPNTLAALTAEHRALRDHSAQRAFYDQRLFPALRDAFMAQPGADSPLTLLILPVSNRYVPVLAAARWKPQIAYPIYSSRSVEHRPFIEAHLADLGIACQGQEVLNIEIEPDRLYAAIKAAIQPYLRAGALNPQIAVDITGGTSVMSVGAAMAVSLVGGRFFYILSGAQRDDITQRLVGTEEPRPLVDPYAVFGDLDAAEARRLFAAHDYAGAQRIFALLGQRVPGEDA